MRREAPQAPSARTVDFVEAYLAWSRLNLSTDTHRLDHGDDVARAGRAGDERRRQELAEGVVEPKRQGRPPKEWGVSTAHNARTAAFRVFSWARKEGLMPENPLAGMERPKPPPRQRAMTDEEFDRLSANAGGPFRDILLAMRETGARPKEVRDLLWSQAHEDRWVLARHKTSRKVQRRRASTS